MMNIPNSQANIQIQKTGAKVSSLAEAMARF